MNFCFVLDDLLAASSQPGTNRRVQEYLNLYRENNIKVLVSLFKRIELPRGSETHFTTYHFRMEDDTLPSVAELDRIVDVILGHMRRREPVNVNDAAGMSRSGLVCIATIMKFLELPADAAHKRVAEQRYAIEEEDVIALLKDYGRHLAAKGGEPGAGRRP